MPPAVLGSTSVCCVAHYPLMALAWDSTLAQIDTGGLSQQPYTFQFTSHNTPHFPRCLADPLHPLLAAPAAIAAQPANPAIAALVNQNPQSRVNCLAKTQVALLPGPHASDGARVMITDHPGWASLLVPAFPCWKSVLPQPLISRASPVNTMPDAPGCCVGR